MSASRASSLGGPQGERARRADAHVVHEVLEEREDRLVARRAADGGQDGHVGVLAQPGEEDHLLLRIAGVLPPELLEEGVDRPQELRGGSERGEHPQAPGHARLLLVEELAHRLERLRPGGHQDGAGLLLLVVVGDAHLGAHREPQAEDLERGGGPVLAQLLDGLLAVLGRAPLLRDLLTQLLQAGLLPRFAAAEEVEDSHGAPSTTRFRRAGRSCRDPGAASPPRGAPRSPRGGRSWPPRTDLPGSLP